MTLPNLDPKEIRYDGVHCSLVIQQFPPAVVVLRIIGSDVGEFGDAPMRSLDNWIARGQIRFFVDAREGRGVSLDVSEDWAQWLSAHRHKLASITMLTGSQLIHVTAGFVRRFAALEGLMRICTDATVFDAALTEALQLP